MGTSGHQDSIFYRTMSNVFLYTRSGIVVDVQCRKINDAKNKEERMNKNKKLAIRNYLTIYVYTLVYLPKMDRNIRKKKSRIYSFVQRINGKWKLELISSCVSLPIKIRFCRPDVSVLMCNISFLLFVMPYR